MFVSKKESRLRDSPPAAVTEFQWYLFSSSRSGRWERCNEKTQNVFEAGNSYIYIRIYNLERKGIYL
jgi:hypothetical protein